MFQGAKAGLINLERLSKLSLKKSAVLYSSHVKPHKPITVFAAIRLLNWPLPGTSLAFILPRQTNIANGVLYTQLDHHPNFPFQSGLVV